jgi:hypothetical protein
MDRQEMVDKLATERAKQVKERHTTGTAQGKGKREWGKGILVMASKLGWDSGLQEMGASNKTAHSHN